MKNLITLSLILAAVFCGCTSNTQSIAFDEGTLNLTALQEDAVRIRYTDGTQLTMPEMVYEPVKTSVRLKKNSADGKTVFSTKEMTITVDTQDKVVTIADACGKVVFKATGHELKEASVQGEATREATLTLDSPQDEYLYGLGQFQDGFLNVKGLTRRLTQVNTQISIPFLLSSKGYGILWNNYGLTDFNPADNKVVMARGTAEGEERRVNVTSTEGGRWETRRNNNFEASVEIPEDGSYAILLDVGQKMARRHNLSIDGETVADLRNSWLPPTTTVIVNLTAGTHKFTAELERGDSPVLYFRKIEDNTVFRSPVAECVDYTVFTGSADKVIASYREATGEAPMLPSWALGYIHCRERFHSQEELLATARRFREEQIPIDLIVQDWQYWGKYGWNAMKFDEEFYPDPAEMVAELHDMDMKLMLSVWSKIDPASEVGKEAQERGLFIPETTWIDFFDPEASGFYWENFSSRLLPIRIDAWWQDATEPENDDLEGRRIMKGAEPGEKYRNIYPNMVNKTVYEGLRRDDPQRRAMIFTRSGFSGIQKYGAVLWSGDVGNDWQTLRYQIAAGLNFMASGLPWWTYDAGGFFRPRDQYSNPEYIERLIRWVQAGTFLPLMRVHGYMSNTEPWNYGPDAQRIITDYIRLRYTLMPYIYSEAAQVTFDGSTFMRPFVFDFPGDQEALKQTGSYMFGKSILVSPVMDGGVSQWKVYLPENQAGWYDWWTGRKLDGGQYVNAEADIETIPVYVKGGSIVPTGPDRQHVAEKVDGPVVFNVYPGADASFTLYEDEGINYNYEDGAYSTITLNWNDAERSLTIGNRSGSFEGMEKERTFSVNLMGETRTVEYNGNQITVTF
jgi:alpha-D-xyloside xylohydrolase